MTVQARIQDLLARYQELRRQGQNPSLASLCRDCPEMRSELELRIRELERGAAMTNQDPYRTADVSVLPKLEAPSAGLPIIPGFQILGELGRGGMGIVYKAVQQPPLCRLVALKVIKDGQFADAVQLDRFQKEVAAIAALQHPNIIQIYAYGDSHHPPYFTMEFAGGGSLDRKIRTTGPCPAEEAAQLVETLAKATHHVHEKNILHRDLKPANVLLFPDGTPKITDFGLAKRLDGSQGSSTGGVGTYLYMAPEQIDGPSEQLGPAVDVYALGGILYELLTGRPAFLGPNIAVILDKIRDRRHLPEFPAERKPPVPRKAPAVRSKASAADDKARTLEPVPRDLQAICLKCLAKVPELRYASAQALARDIDHWRHGKPIEAGSTSGQTRRLTDFIRTAKAPKSGPTDWFVCAGFEVKHSLGRRGPGLERLLVRSQQLQRDVVLKVFTAERNSQLHDDFHQEARTVQRLRHPNIPEFLGKGALGGRLFLIFEYIEGHTLRDHLKLKSLSVGQAVQIMKTLAEVMHYAHEEGVVHRDLQPRNVLIDPHGVMKLKDLGLPRPWSEPSGAAASSPDLLGYTAPEQGPEGAADPAMNIYSLGVILYEMLAGRRPSLIGRPGPKRVPLSNERGVLVGAWESPSSLHKGVPAQLDAVCLRCLQWDPRDRFPTAEALANELARLLPLVSK